MQKFKISLARINKHEKKSGGKDEDVSFEAFVYGVHGIAWKLIFFPLTDLLFALPTDLSGSSLGFFRCQNCKL
jgi:hypothetical protein